MKVGAFFTYTPNCVLGGIETFLFGTIAVAGIKVIMEENMIDRRTRFIMVVARCRSALRTPALIASIQQTHSQHSGAGTCCLLRLGIELKCPPSTPHFWASGVVACFLQDNGPVQLKLVYTAITAP